MKHIRIFTLGCLYLGSFVSLPFGLKAEGTKVVKVTFDAKDYQSDRDWKKFIEALCETLKQHPDYGKTDKTFDVNITNGAVLGTDPQSLESYFENDNEREQIEEVLSKISRLEADTERFSLLSLKRIFADATEIHLLNTKTVTDSLEGCAEKLNLIFHRSFTLENNLTWSQFIERIREELGKYPDDKRIRFRLVFKNGFIFGEDPGEIDYRDDLGKKESEQTEITKILSRIELLRVNTERFSTLSLSKVFPWTQVLIIPNAEQIYGSCDSVDLELKASDWNTMQTMFATYKKFAPRLQTVYAPKVIRIGNAAFFGFENLKYFNAQGDFPVPEHPAIVCTRLPENYFAQKQSPAGARIAPVTVKKKLFGYKDNSPKTVEIGACAFQWCLSLQHVSAHASLIGSGAFAASGLKSAHLLLSEKAPVGDDVFFNCFGLKECFMMLGRTERGTVNSFFNGLFWNCFALETVCMPNIRYPYAGQASGKPRKIKTARSINYNEDSLTMFMNCFSLKELDLRSFEKNYCQFLPYWIIRSNHDLMAKEKIEGWESYRSTRFASERDVPKDTGDPGKIGEYVELCRRKAEKPFDFLQTPDRQSTFKNHIYAKPYCDIRIVVDCRTSKDIKSGLDKKRLSTWIKTRNFSCNPEKVLYDPFFFPTSPAFQRFNDAYLQWFVKEEEGKAEEKPENKILNKKTKRTNFVLHGG